MLLHLAHAQANVPSSPGVWQASEHECLGHSTDSCLPWYPVAQVLPARGSGSAGAMLGAAAPQSHTHARSSPAEHNLCARFPFLPNLFNR